MLVLALDATTRAGSCALARDGRVLREEASDQTLPPAARLPGELIALLEHEDVALADVDIFSVATGPGSFTGLRIAIATMQGLALATGKPLIGVSGFEALAAIGGARQLGASQHPFHEGHVRIAAWVDAWRNEVYAALYEAGREVDPPTVARPELLLPRLAGADTLFVGDGAAVHAEAIRAALGDRARFANPLTPLLAGAIAELATETARAGHRPPPHAIRPLYVRRPDAELTRDHQPRKHGVTERKP
jgi:tRNA threonylcarbamoyladenosine biosynthesis protein TsaB